MINEDLFIDNPPQRLTFLDHGVVELLDCSPRNICYLDQRILDACRVSYSSNKTKKHTDEDDKKLINYLFKHAHTSPLEMIDFTFYLKMPIFIARQLTRHRTASLNEISGRYSELATDFYAPERFKTQSTANKQGSGEFLPEKVNKTQLKNLNSTYTNLSMLYKDFILEGISKEQARIVLPVSTYTEMVWKIDLKNLLSYLNLRLDPHAQEEIRSMSKLMLQSIEPYFKWVIEAWNDTSPYRNAILFTREELRQLNITAKSEVVPPDLKGKLKKYAARNI